MPTHSLLQKFVCTPKSLCSSLIMTTSRSIMMIFSLYGSYIWKLFVSSAYLDPLLLLRLVYHCRYFEYHQLTQARFLNCPYFIRLTVVLSALAQNRLGRFVSFSMFRILSNMVRFIRSVIPFFSGVLPIPSHARLEPGVDILTSVVASKNSQLLASLTFCHALNSSYASGDLSSLT